MPIRWQSPSVQHKLVQIAFCFTKTACYSLVGSRALNCGLFRGNTVNTYAIRCQETVWFWSKAAAAAQTIHIIRLELNQLQRTRSLLDLLLLVSQLIYRYRFAETKRKKPALILLYLRCCNGGAAGLYCNCIVNVISNYVWYVVERTLYVCAC